MVDKKNDRSQTVKRTKKADYMKLSNQNNADAHRNYDSYSSWTGGSPKSVAKVVAH